jgi:hypothetical protein
MNNKRKKKDSTSPLLEWLPSRTQITTNVCETLGEKETLNTVGGDVNSYNHFGKQYAGSSKTKNITDILCSNSIPRDIPKGTLSQVTTMAPAHPTLLQHYSQ